MRTGKWTKAKVLLRLVKDDLVFDTRIVEVQAATVPQGLWDRIRGVPPRIDLCLMTKVGERTFSAYGDGAKLTVDQPVPLMVTPVREEDTKDA